MSAPISQPTPRENVHTSSTPAGGGLRASGAKTLTRHHRMWETGCLVHALAAVASISVPARVELVHSRGEQSEMGQSHSLAGGQGFAEGADGDGAYSKCTVFATSSFRETSLKHFLRSNSLKTSIRLYTVNHVHPNPRGCVKLGRLLARLPKSLSPKNTRHPFTRRSLSCSEKYFSLPANPAFLWNVCRE